MNYDPYQPGQYQRPPPPQPPQKRKHKGLRITLGIIGGLIVIIIIASVASSPKTTTPPASTPAASGSAVATSSAPPASPSPKPAAQTVTYIVTGSAADVTYGPAGTDLSGTVPMTVTKPLGSPQFYSISAQLQGSGDVKCVIEVDGKAISSAEGSGGYNIAQCEVSPNPLTGKWEDTNG